MVNDRPRQSGRSHRRPRSVRWEQVSRASRSCPRLCSRDSFVLDPMRPGAVPEESVDRLPATHRLPTQRARRRTASGSRRWCQREPRSFACFTRGARTVLAAVLRRGFSFFFKYSATSGAISSTYPGHHGFGSFARASMACPNRSRFTICAMAWLIVSE
jgi:hypothetical protein